MSESSSARSRGSAASACGAAPHAPPTAWLGTVGALAVFAWTVILVMAAPPRLLPWAAAASLSVAAVIYPRGLRRIVSRRVLLLLGLLALPPLFLVGELDRHFLAIPYSSTGLLLGAQMALRLIVVLAAVDGLTASVDIASIAGLLERAGLHGLGFSMGVALNLLPALQTAALHAWQSLWLRGGLRRKRLRGLRLLMVTILANALARAEEIALAAEARAYTPARSRRLPIQVGRWDWLVAAVGGLSLLGLALWQLMG